VKCLLSWFLKLFSFGRPDKDGRPQPAPTTKTIIPVLIFPRLTDDIEFGQTLEIGDDKYYLSAP
jgi:hypothetical protein